MSTVSMKTIISQFIFTYFALIVNRKKNNKNDGNCKINTV